MSKADPFVRQSFLKLTLSGGTPAVYRVRGEPPRGNYALWKSSQNSLGGRYMVACNHAPICLCLYHLVSVESVQHFFWPYIALPNTLYHPWSHTCITLQFIVRSRKCIWSAALLAHFPTYLKTKWNFTFPTLHDSICIHHMVKCVWSAALLAHFTNDFNQMPPSLVSKKAARFQCKKG